MIEADYLGIESGNKVNKIEVSKLHVIKSEFVDAPLFEEFPLSIDCKVLEMKEGGDGYLLIGEILNTSCDEKMLTNDKIDLDKIKPIMFDSSSNTYRVIGEVVGNAFNDGLKLKS